jgi:hypothetical protein
MNAPTPDSQLKRVIRSPRGTTLSARSWLTEAPLRMLMNNLDPEVAENPAELVVYGGIGKAARNWEAYDAIVAALRRLGENETLLIQSGKPVGVFKTHADAPRVLIANSNLVGKWATWDHFHELDRKGLMMYGQMTAGVVDLHRLTGHRAGTYETFVEMARKHFDNDWKGRWILTAGLGGMGGAQPLAAVLAGASCVVIECQQSRIDMRLKTRYLDRQAQDIDEALEVIAEAHADGKAVSVGIRGNAAELLPEYVARGIRPDAVTDQTSAHDLVNGYLPIGWTVEQWWAVRDSGDEAARKGLVAEAQASAARHVKAMLAYHRMGLQVIDYGNNLRQVAFDAGVQDAFDYPGLRPRLHPAAFLRRQRPVPLGGVVGQPGRHLSHRREGQAALSGRQAAAPLARPGTRKDRLSGVARADLLAGARTSAPRGPCLQRDGPHRRTGGPHRDRPRPPRHRFGGESQPRDGIDGRWQRCGRRLAAAQRDAQCRRRGHLGLDTPRRRRRHRLLSARRGRHRLRRDRGRGEADRAGALERSGQRRHAACRRGLR